MKFLPFLVFLACVTVCDNYLLGEELYAERLKDGTLKRHTVAYPKYTQEISTIFQPDTYYCRTPLGMSYGMLRAYPSQPEDKELSKSNPIWISRPYTMYSKIQFSLLPEFVDRYFRDYMNKDRDHYVGYVEVRFEHMTMVDGMINEGSVHHPRHFSISKGHESAWTLGLTRFSVNYTMDGKEWLSYRDEEGEIKEFGMREMNRLDGILVSAYTKFQPRIIARKIRIMFISYRLSSWSLKSPSLIMELFGCDYEPENEGLQHGNRRRSDLTIGRTTLYPWQLIGSKSGHYQIEPIHKPFMALSGIYSVGKRAKYPMPDGYGWCTTSSYRQLIIESLRGGTYRFNRSPIKAVYPSDFVPEKPRWDYHKYAGDCCNDHEHCWGYSQLRKRKLVSAKHIKWKTDGQRLRIYIDKAAGKKKPCVQEISYSRLSFVPEKIIRSKGCNSLLQPFGDTKCGKLDFDFDLGKICILDSFTFRGHQQSLSKSWVSRLTISYSPDGIAWMPVKDRYATNSIFTANRNQHSPVVIYLNPRLRARFLKIVPVSGKGGSCFRVEIRGCAKEPWREEQQRIMLEAKKIGFGLWIDAVTNHRYLATINKLDCITGKASILDQFVGTYRMYKIIQNYEFEMKIKRKYDVYGGDKQAQFYKCNIRDRHGNIISTQLHIVRTTGFPGLILPVQEVGLMHNGGLPVLDFPGTVWTYEPNIAKLTFLFFPEMKYSYSYYGEYDEYVLKLFHLSVVGKGRSAKECLQLAVYNHHSYFVINAKNRECLTSWYLPLAAKVRENEPGKAGKKNNIYKIYRVHQSRKPYIATWRRNYLIGSCEVKKEAPHPSPVFFTQPQGMGRYRFYFDSYLTTNRYDSHTLVIKNFIQSDLSYYKLQITELESPKAKYSRMVNLRHFGQPRLNLTLYTGACVSNPLRIAAVPIRGEHQEAKEWNVEWKKMVRGKPVKTRMETSDPFELYAKKATLKHNGRYRIRVNNRYGFAEAFTNVEVVSQLPTISSATPSPHIAVEDTSDVLQMTVKNDKDLISVDWQHNGEPIELTDNYYSFPGAVSGRPETRKMLKLSNMHSGMNGVYKVTSKAKYCQFHKEIRVEVYVRPRMVVSPGVQTIYQIAGGNTTEIKIVVTGGIPEPEINNLFWYKNSKPLQFTKTGRVSIHTLPWRDYKSRGKRIGWNSTLLIGSPHEADSGTYSFIVSFPRANYTVERVVKVTKIAEDII